MDDTLGICLLVATHYLDNKENIVILANNLYNAQKIFTLISSLVGSNNVYLFPNDELIRSNNLTSSKELTSSRLFALNAAIKEKNKIFILHPSSLLRYLPSPDLFKQLCIEIKVGDKLDVDNFINKLVISGYYRVNKIDKSLEFAKRGDIIDVFSINQEYPIRISLFDNEIESISIFDIATQTSKEKINKTTIIPASDILLNENERNNFKEKILKQLKKDQEIYNIDEDKIHEVIERIGMYDYNESIYKYYSFIQEKHYSFLDYLKADLIIYSNYQNFNSSKELLLKESREYLYQLTSEHEAITHLELYNKFDDVISKNKNVIKCQTYKEDSSNILFNVRPIISDNYSANSILSTITNYFNTNKKIIICLMNVSQLENVKNILKDANIDFEEVVGLSLPKKHIGLSIYSLNEGFELVDEEIVVLTSRELFNYRSGGAYISHFKEGNILHSYEELKPGDYVVHEYNGIGKFIDIETLEVDGIHRDFIHIEYANKDKLYVPLNQFRLVRKYMGREGYTPKLSSLNGKAWSKTKEKIKARLNELTNRLTNLYKERASIAGYAFNKDDEYQEKFNNEFAYELTDDQAQAYRDIRDDMEKPYPMDRLLCGDVGFGKTEVAFRAIFKCINNGKQAALLCPTTLLCRQHYELAKIRFASFGINIAIFSRLIPLKQQKIFIKEIKEGKTHLIIGTHRMLNKDIEFNNLGLLVVDEEQRFGVEQKERIKEIKKDVDVLSLSATPIPRTLQMSLVGVRELSQINTPPLKRSSIQTYVAPFDKTIVKELIERELSREGQVFYIHNNVYSIFETANQLKRMIPLANIRVVHGKMSKDEIEDVMIKFYNNEINLLVATSIIENGIDVPNANMIIVENADTFGLSQLYQIKGRVGRGDRIAYAYLFFNPNKVMKEEASKRLKAIQEFAELGSGYKIAQRDLMIRGAGDMLGKEQAGFIDSIGIDLYIKLLNEAVKENRKEIIIEHKPNKLFSLDAYIPNNYVDKSEKVEIYQEIENAKDIKTVNQLKDKLKDVYGKLPFEVENLITKKKIDIITASEEFRTVKDYEDKIVIFLSGAFCEKNGIAMKLFDALYRYMHKIKVSYLKKELRIELAKEGLWLIDLENIAIKIHKVYLKESYATR